MVFDRQYTLYRDEQLDPVDEIEQELKFIAKTVDGKVNHECEYFSTSIEISCKHHFIHKLAEVRKILMCSNNNKRVKSAKFKLQKLESELNSYRWPGESKIHEINDRVAKILVEYKCNA